MNTKLIEVQIDRLVGPTHHFSGLGVGNVASITHAGKPSNPAAAAIQGLEKIKLVASYGVPQWVLPPQPRPDLGFLRNLGFEGDDESILKQACETSPHLFSAAMSCSSMWAANAATVSPAIDNRCGVTTMTVANLISSLHRAPEAEQTLSELREIFPQANVLPPLVGGTAIRDEGAANHMRLGNPWNTPGVHLFVYGDEEPLPKRYYPRCSRLSCEVIARRHGLDSHATFYLKQHPDAIDSGAFHNDVVAMSHHHLLIHHELAFYNAASTMEAMSRRYEQLSNKPLQRIEVKQDELTIEDAVATYLFNSQIITPIDPSSNIERLPVLICPWQVRSHPGASGLVRFWLEELKLFEEVHFVDLSESMSGGGGPACLRLRVPMTEFELSQMNPLWRYTSERDAELRQTIAKEYPQSAPLFLSLH